MFKMILVFLAIFSYNSTTMSDSFKCKIKIDFEKSVSKDYLFTGYGELTCLGDSTPSTIYSAIKVNSKNSAINNIDKFSMETMHKKFDVLSYLFQTYTVKTSHNFLVMQFDGDENFPARTLGTLLKGDFEGTNRYETLIDLLPESELIIEQDQFWEDEI